MQLIQPFLRHVSINLRAGQVAMPEQQLHHPEVRAMIQQMGGKCMPKGMWR